MVQRPAPPCSTQPFLRLSLLASAVAVLTSGCVHAAPLSAPSTVAGLAAQSEPASVRALKKAIRSQLEERTNDHQVTVDRLDPTPTVIWNVFNFEGTLVDDAYEEGSFTFKIGGTYDMLTKTVTLTEKLPMAMAQRAPSSRQAASQPR